MGWGVGDDGCRGVKWLGEGCEVGMGEDEG